MASRDGRDRSLQWAVYKGEAWDKTDTQSTYDWWHGRMVKSAGYRVLGTGPRVMGTARDQELCIRTWHREEACHSFIQWPSGTGRLLRMPQQRSEDTRSSASELSVQIFYWKGAHHRITDER